MSPNGKRFAHALLMGAFALGLSVALGSGFHVEHRQDPAGLEVHQLLGWAAGAATALHLALRWRWIASVVPRLPHLRGPVLTNFVLGAFLALAVGLEVASGALLEPGTAWQGLHHLSSKLVIATAIWHVVRHRSWLAARLLPKAGRPAVENPLRGVGRAR